MHNAEAKSYTEKLDEAIAEMLAQ
jgi:hypothetical protein